MTAKKDKTDAASAPLPQNPAEALAELMPRMAVDVANEKTAIPQPAYLPRTGRVSFFNSAFAVFLVALLIRLCFAWNGLSEPESMRFFRPDTDSYLAPAFSLAELGEYRGPDGSITAHRTPGFPVFLSVLVTFGVRPESAADTNWISIFLLVLGALTVFPIYLTCRYFASRTGSALAALLFALNPTAIAHAPMLLSDTFFMLLTSFVLFFFVSFAFGVRKDPFYLYSGIVLAALAALVRPVNMLFFLPMIVAVWLTNPFPLKQKKLATVLILLIFFAVLFPWTARNHAIGAGWRLDAGSTSTMMHNASTLESVISGTDGATLRARYEEDVRYLCDEDPLLYSTDGERMSLMERKMWEKILAHPFVYIWLSLRPWVLLPDVPTLLENLGVTRSERGTFDVLNREGIFAAVRHYFDENGAALAAMIPLLLTVLALYLAAAAGWILTLKRKQYLTAFLLVGFGLYYTLITGPVQMPRYHMPLLPVLCLFAAIAFEAYFRHREKA